MKADIIRSLRAPLLGSSYHLRGWGAAVGALVPHLQGPGLGAKHKNRKDLGKVLTLSLWVTVYPPRAHL